MSRLAEHHIQTIIELLQAGQDLPFEYKLLLFPPGQSDYDLLRGTDSEETMPLAGTKIKGTILVVDDNTNNRELLRDHLEWEGHTVTTAENGQQALLMMQSAHYDLILLDIMMPIMDGYQVLQHMRDDPDLRHIPVVVISALSDIQSIVRCIELGAEDYLFKPFDAVLLQARINASLEKKKLRDQEQTYLRMLEIERERSEHLLLNILPRPIANRLKRQQSTIADNFHEVTVLFADIVDFASYSAGVTPTELVDVLNGIFSTFDMLAEKHGLEKIKTVGDAYMVVGGLPMPRPDHAEAIADMALDMQQAIKQFKTHTGSPFQMRIGINTGPVVAGVIGTKKFIYDLWGDAVNIASRMESHGIPGQIQVTVDTYERLHDKYEFRERGMIPVKGKGEIMAYLLIGKR